MSTTVPLRKRCSTLRTPILRAQLRCCLWPRGIHHRATLHHKCVLVCAYTSASSLSCVCRVLLQLRVFAIVGLTLLVISAVILALWITVEILACQRYRYSSAVSY